MDRTSLDRATGSCLCGRARFAVFGRIDSVGQCLCPQCRKVSGTNGNAVFLVPNDRFEWVEAEPETVKFSLPSGWSVSRCRQCGSPLPQSHDGERTWVTAGLMDDPIGTNVGAKIFCGSRADWDSESEHLVEFEAFPGES